MGTPEGVIHSKTPRLAQHAVLREQCGPDRTSCVARSRLHPKILKWSFADHAAIRDAIKCYTAGHAQVFQVGALVEIPNHSKYDLLGHLLDACRHVPVELLYFRLAFAHGMAKE